MQYSGIISKVLPGSIAEELGLNTGDKLISINGEHPQDIIDLSFSLSEEYIELEVEKKDGQREIFEIEKDYDDELGLEFESAVFDKVRRCANHCIFCFVDQMPAGMRESLYVKDDDYRLSFLYGNFITLTNLGPRDFKRIHTLHLSPLYVSVHTTNPQLREKMVGNNRAGSIADNLRKLINCGTEVHTQIVLCPGINDGEVLEQTITDLYSMHPQLISLAIVPVGLTRYRDNCYHLNTFSPKEARTIINQVERWQDRSRKESGVSFVYLSDEFYLNAGCPIPEANYYDGFPQLENGIGLVRSFLEEWEEVKSGKTVGYPEPLYLDIVCGVSAYKVLAPLLKNLHIPNLITRLVPVNNAFFGNGVTVTGLLTGNDILNELKQLTGPRTGVILPGVALRKGENVFLDELTVPDIANELNVIVRPAYYAADLFNLLAEWR